jgi:hypothetical protein
MRDNMKSNMKNRRISTIVASGALLCAWATNAPAIQTWLAMRCESAVCLHNGTTCQTVEDAFGTNLATLAFTGTTTYDFYSPKLSAAVSLTPSDKGGGVIYMRNTATTTANDFSVSGRMQFFDYDPVTGTEALIVDTTASPAKDVNHGQTVNWAIPNALLPASVTISAGHMVHIVMTIGLVAGDPASFGQVVYNGPAGPSTAGLLPQNRSTVLNWPFNVIGSPGAIVSYARLPDQTMSLTCSGTAGAAYSIQATADLAAPVWTTLLTTNSPANGLFSFVDQDAKILPSRFYRISTAR